MLAFLSHTLSRIVPRVLPKLKLHLSGSRACLKQGLCGTGGVRCAVLSVMHVDAKVRWPRRGHGGRRLVRRRVPGDELLIAFNRRPGHATSTLRDCYVTLSSR